MQNETGAESDQRTISRFKQSGLAPEEQMFIDRYKHFVPTGRRIASHIIALTIAMSFLATLLPIAIASANNTMACCIGKTAGHCESGIAAEKAPEPDPEPMCGLSNPHSEDDGITIVAEPATHNSHHSAATTSSSPAADTKSLGRPCEMDCCACAVASSRRQRRDDASAEFIGRIISPLATASQFESVSLSFSSNEDWKQTSPRGPPASLR